tara:strand:+ start:88 stop:438 length:351 start_codon:yes stop_codon:yes gene_type:complete
MSSIPLQMSTSLGAQYRSNEGQKPVDYIALKYGNLSSIRSTMEYHESQRFLEKLKRQECEVPFSKHTMKSVNMSNADAMAILIAGYATFLLHVEARAAAALGLFLSDRLLTPIAFP